MKVNRLLYIIMTMGVLLSSVGCGPAPQPIDGLLVAGTGDLAYLSFMINDWAAENPEVPLVNMALSTESIDQLKKGNCDAVLLGREPTAAELEGLKDYIIAYDAVCLTIDESSYIGGVNGPASMPSSKTTGIKDLPLSSVESILTTGYTWEGEFYNIRPGLDPGSILLTLDGGTHAWEKTPVVLSSAFVFPLGKFDTQTILFEKLGIDEQQALESRTSLTSPRYKIEEEVISYEYTSSIYSQKFGIQSFSFKVGFASRRVMTVAPSHVPVRTLSIDGIDPMTNTTAVIDGSYPFSRKIHLLIREDASPEVQNLAALVLSVAGQQFIRDAGYIPVDVG